MQALVTPSTVISKDGRPVTFAFHGFIEFKSLGEMFPYIESQTQRWNTPSGLDEAGRRDLARDLLRRGIESRIVSMVDERPLETLITHTGEELPEMLGHTSPRLGIRFQPGEGPNNLVIFGPDGEPFATTSN